MKLSRLVLFAGAVLALPAAISAKKETAKSAQQKTHGWTPAHAEAASAIKRGDFDAALKAVINRILNEDLNKNAKNPTSGKTLKELLEYEGRPSDSDEIKYYDHLTEVLE